MVACLVVSLFSSCVVFVSADTVNVIYNGSFETKTLADLPVGWTDTDFRVEESTSGTPYAVSGAFTCFLAYPYLETGQIALDSAHDFDLTPLNSSLVTSASVWIYSNRADIGAHLMLEWTNASGLQYDEVTVLTSADAWYKLEFTPASATPNVPYDNIRVYFDTVHAGDYVWIDEVQLWTSQAGFGSGSSPTPAPTTTPNLEGVDWSGAMLWIGVMVLMLVPPFLLGVLLRGGKWGFLIGLAIGTGLSYYVFITWFPIWLVLLVAVGLGAAFLTQIRSGG